MRRLVIFALVLAVLPACKKAMDTSVKPNEKFTTTKDWLTEQKGPGNQPAVHAPTGVVINPGGGGGSGGAAQAVRRAATRTVNYNEMANLRLTIAAMALDGRMPTKQEIEQSLMREAPATYKLVSDNVIILTGTKSRENIWAYTYDPQTAAGEHLVVRSENVEKVKSAELRQDLQQQQGR